MCSLQTGLWALIVFTVLVRGLDVSPGVGFWVHDKPRNFGELQLALPLIIFPCFFDFGRIIATNAQKNPTRALPCFSDIHLYHLDMGHCCISLNGQPAHGSSNYFVAGPATVALSQM